MFKHWEILKLKEKYKNYTLEILKHGLKDRTLIRFIIKEAINTKTLFIIEPLITDGIALKVLNHYNNKKT